MEKRTVDELLDAIDEQLGEHDARVMDEFLQQPGVITNDEWRVRSLRNMGASGLSPRFSDESEGFGFTELEPDPTED